MDEIKGKGGIPIHRTNILYLDVEESDIEAFYVWVSTNSFFSGTAEKVIKYSTTAGRLLRVGVTGQMHFDSNLS